MTSQTIQDFIQKYNAYLAAQKLPDTKVKIHVDEIASKIATFYERARSIIEYKEEHLLRKHVIGRILKRRILFKDISQNIAEPLIKEIIRSGHLANDTIPEEKIPEIEKNINNLLFLLEHLKNLPSQEKSDLTQWLLNITVCVIEENLAPPVKDSMLADLMFQIISKDLIINDSSLSENDQKLQLFIAVQKTLLRVDEDQLNHRLLKFVYPNWYFLPLEELSKIADKLPIIKTNIDRQINAAQAPIFFRLCNQYNTIFYLLGDIIYGAKNPEEVEKNFSDPESLEKAVKGVYQKRYKREKGRLSRLAFLTVISILLSKIAVALAVEIPIDLYILEKFSLIHTVANIGFPPFLMLLIVTLIRLPSNKNLELVLKETKSIVFEENRKKYLVNMPKKKSVVTQIVVYLIYLLTSAISFYYLIKALSWFGFSLAGIIVFILFTSLVAATGVKVYNRSKDISMEEEKATILNFLIDLISLPFVTIGRWAIAFLSKLNILTILINLIIELPFQLFIEFLENFRSFIRSKKEQIN